MSARPESKKPEPVFIKVDLSDRERVTIVMHFRAQGAWDTDGPDTMLALGEVYDTLGIVALDLVLAKVEERGAEGTKVDLDKFSHKRFAYKLSPPGLHILRALLARKGQPAPVALLSLGVLRRIKAP